MPNARLQVLEGCGHWPHFEQPEALAKSVLDFIRS
jgi:pimeloyl-ACP methyl ester carboxylesterase